jgi:hypothetical protein
VRRQVHTRYRGQPNRKARKVVNLRVSQWKRRHGVPSHEQLPPMAYLKAAYGEAFYLSRLNNSPLARMLVRSAFG